MPDFMPKLQGFHIQGQTGPHPQTSPGWYGRNAAYQLQWYASQAPEFSDSFYVQYSPGNNPAVSDALGFGEESVRIFDTNGSGVLEQEELNKAIGFTPTTALEIYRMAEERLVSMGKRAMPGTPQWKKQTRTMMQSVRTATQALEKFSQKFMQVLGQGKPHVDSIALSAYTMFEDDIIHVLPKTVGDLEKNALLPEGTRDLVQRKVDEKLAEYGETYSPNGRADGIITPAESAIAQMAVDEMPRTAQLFLAHLREVLKNNMSEVEVTVESDGSTQKTVHPLLLQPPAGDAFNA